MIRARIAGVVLAAGGSRRMGRPKVLREIDDEPLVRRVVRIATDAGLAPLIAVGGSEVDAIRAALAGTEASVVENREWGEGLGSSIRCGIGTLRPGELEGAVLLLADQPFVTADHLKSLVAAFESGSDPVATRYGRAPGVPALFGSRWFADLAALAGDRGARELLSRAGATAIGDGSAPLDIDTEADYERALGR